MIKGTIPQKTLVVDDEADVRQILLCILAPLCEVFEASNGTDALRLMRKEKPGLMLLDISMPGMGGMAVLERARAKDPNLVVVMLTAEKDLSVAKRALEKGAKAYITKPFDLHFLRDEVRRLLQMAESPPPDRPWKVRP